MTIRVELAWSDDADQQVALPSPATNGSSGADLRANLGSQLRASGVCLERGKARLIPTGLRIAIPAGFEAQVRPRSGLALRHGLTVLNSPGTIDSDYRGEIRVLMINLGDADVTIHHGERIAQLLISAVSRAEFHLVRQLVTTDRGCGGFGSTGQT